MTHEPLGDRYAARRFLGAGSPEQLPANARAHVDTHLDMIDEVLETRTYIECGHPSWSAIPFLVRRFTGRVRVVHLVRHPVPTAWSWVTHQAYCPPLAPHLAEKILVSPFDEGVAFPAVADRWAQMSPYEKALYYWAEVNELALRLEAANAAPWHRVRFEELFRLETLERITRFAGIDAATPARLPGPVDEFRYLAAHWSDPRAIERHPEVCAVSRALGYDPLAFDEAAVRVRYFGQLPR